MFSLLEGLSFSLLLLEKCSQMTEPASLLPMARYRQSQGLEGEGGREGWLLPMARYRQSQGWEGEGGREGWGRGWRKGVREGIGEREREGGSEC